MSCLCSGSMILRWYHDGYCAGITSKVRYCAGITKDIALVSVRVMLMINVLIDNDCVLY